MGYASPILRAKAIGVSDDILLSNSDTFNNNTDVYVTELSGVVSESLIYPSKIRFTLDFNNQVDFKIEINGATVWAHIQDYGGWTTVSQDIFFYEHIPGELVEVKHKRNGAFGAVSSFRNFSIRGTTTPIIVV